MFSLKHLQCVILKITKYVDTDRVKLTRLIGLDLRDVHEVLEQVHHQITPMEQTTVNRKLKIIDISIFKEIVYIFRINFIHKIVCIFRINFIHRIIYIFIYIIYVLIYLDVQSETNDCILK